MSQDASEELPPSPAQGSEGEAAGALSRYRPTPDGHRDSLLDRAVAVRAVGTAGADDLLAEARFLARLEHAGIPCVHDLERGDHGALLVTRPVEGSSLAEAAQRAAAGSPVPELATAGACCATILKVCNALAAAHARGIVHHAVRPECVLLGWHGQVLISDWRTAMAKAERPETLRLIAGAVPSPAVNLDGLHEDIRGLGACLFTALALRPPRSAADDPLALVGSESARVPRALEVVVRRALASDAANGYRCVDEFAADLAAFLDGRLPTAYRPGPGTRLLRWIAIHRRGLAATALAMVLVVGAIAVLYGERIRSWVVWGEPILVEDFADDGWRERFKEGQPGSFERRDGALVTTGERGSVLVIPRRLTTPLAIEYTGTILPGARPGDLSVWWTEHDDALRDPIAVSEKTRSFRIQSAAYENSYCAIFSSPGYERVAHANRQLVPGQQHRFRVQLDGDRFRMWIDGELTLDHRELFPTASGYLALYGYFPGKAFDGLRIWQQRVPDLVSPLAVGDAFYQAGLYAQAAEAWGRVAGSHAGWRLGDEALFRQGLSARRLNDPAAAEAAWMRLDGADLQQRADVIRLGDRAGDDERFGLEFRAQWNGRPAMHSELRALWQRVASAPRDGVAAERLLALRDGLFAQDDASAFLAAELLLRQQRFAEVLRRHPRERRACAQAMLALGRSDEVLAADWTISDERNLALLNRGDFRRLADDPQQFSWTRAIVLSKLGRGEEAVRLPESGPHPAWLHLGRAAELLDLPGLSQQARGDALLVLGRLDEAAAQGDERALILLGRLEQAEAVNGYPLAFPRLIAALGSGNEDAARTWRARVLPNFDQRNRTSWFIGTVALPLIDQRWGRDGALRAGLEHARTELRLAYAGRAALVADAALAADGRAGWDASPLRTESEALQAIAAAVRAELAGDAAAALAGWRAFRALPMHRRLLDEHQPDIDIEVFAAWREVALAAGGR